MLFMLCVRWRLSVANLLSASWGERSTLLGEKMTKMVVYRVVKNLCRSTAHKFTLFTLWMSGHLVIRWLHIRTNSFWSLGGLSSCVLLASIWILLRISLPLLKSILSIVRSGLWLILVVSLSWSLEFVLVFSEFRTRTCYWCWVVGWALSVWQFL